MEFEQIHLGDGAPRQIGAHLRDLNDEGSSIESGVHTVRMNQQRSRDRTPKHFPTDVSDLPNEIYGAQHTEALNQVNLGKKKIRMAQRVKENNYFESRPMGKSIRGPASGSESASHAERRRNTTPLLDSSKRLLKSSKYKVAEQARSHFREPLLAGSKDGESMQSNRKLLAAESQKSFKLLKDLSASPLVKLGRSLTKTKRAE